MSQSNHQKKKEIPFIIPVIPASTPRYCCANPQGLHNGRVLARTVQPTAHPSSSLTSQLAGFSATLTNREAQRGKYPFFLELHLRGVTFTPPLMMDQKLR